jgi:hypothetical protein
VALGLAAGTHAAAPELRAVRLTTLDFRPALRLLTSEDVPPGEVVREGGEVVIRVEAAVAEGLVLPSVAPPLEGIRVEREPPGAVLRVRVAPEVPFEATYEFGMLTVVFGELPAPDLRGPVTPELYRLLFPTGTAPGGPVVEEESLGGSEAEGIALGRTTLRPYVTVSWVDADIAALDSPTPVRDQYLQAAPGVTATMPLFDGLLSAEYEPRLRFFSNIPLVSETSHFARVRLETPVGTRTLVRLGHRYTRAILETTVVDPGREYFYDLALYGFHASTAAARVDLGARLYAEAEVGWQWTRFDDEQSGGFFDYDSRALRAGLGYDVTSDLRATVSYAFDRIPPSPDRAIVESSAHSILGTLAGRVAPLTTGAVTVGLRSQANPLAPGESGSFRGLTLGGSLSREIGPSTQAELRFNRSTEPSSYDTNAYYVTNSIDAALTVPAPLGLWARGSVTWFRNQYPNDAPGLDAPRGDDILAWAVGVGRRVGWRAWIRADYRRERRDSSLPAFDMTTEGLTVQLGIGLFSPGPSSP